MEFLGRMGILYLIVLETTTLFSTATELFCISTSNARVFQFFHILTDTCHFPLFSVIAIPVGVQGYLTVVSFCVSLTTSSVVHFLMCLLPFEYFLWRNGYSSPLTIF